MRSDIPGTETAPLFRVAAALRTPDRPATRHSTRADLRAVALDQFASIGFAGSSLHHIAETAGYSKSVVLYHFASKEALLEDVLTPAVDRLDEILDLFVTRRESADSRLGFIDDFIDFLIEFRLELHIVINQAQSLRGINVIDRAGRSIARLTSTFCPADASALDILRFGIALGGSVYTLVAGMNSPGDDFAPAVEIRPALRVVLHEILAPVPVRPGTSDPETRE